jgi:hypothetical protein
VSSPPAAVSPSPGRRRFERRRRRAFAWSAIAAGTGAAVGGLLVAPGAPGAFRLLGVGLAWWAAWAGFGITLAALLAGLRDATPAAGDPDEHGG